MSTPDEAMHQGFMDELYRLLTTAECEPPEVIYCSEGCYRAYMRSTSSVCRMRDWARCTSRKVRTWKGRRFSYMVPDTWMADRGDH